MASRIVIAVGIAGHPVSAAGNTWAFLQWVLGFQELGWEVWIVEALKREKLAWPKEGELDGTSLNERYWKEVLERFGLASRASLWIDGSSPCAEEARAFASQADLFLNISGHFPLELLPALPATKLYLDLDPAFTQIWAEQYGVDMHFSGHDRFFTVGSLLGRPGSRAPVCRREWLPVLPPVVLSRWPFLPQAEFRAFTTVAHWHGYSWCEWEGEWYKGKNEEFQKFREVPGGVRAPLALATEWESNRQELQPFADAGWQLLEGPEICRTFERYEAFLRGDSSAEFSAVKGGYALSRAGWFSDRSVCYLATGRPVVLQSTGIEEIIPTGCGFHVFRSPEEARAACARVLEDFPAQQAGARRLAEERFDSAKVISGLLDKI